MDKVLLLKPNGKKTTIEEIELKENQVKFEEMYKLIDCRMIQIGYCCKDIPKPIRLMKPVILMDEEFLINGKEPVVNYAATVLTGHVICGNVVIVKESRDDLIGFDDVRLIKMRDVIEFINSVSDDLPDAIIPEPVVHVRSFNSGEELINFIKENE